MPQLEHSAAGLRRVEGPVGTRSFSRSLQTRLSVLAVTALLAGALVVAALISPALLRSTTRAAADRTRLITLAEGQLAQAVKPDLEQLEILASRIASSPIEATPLRRAALRDAYVASRYFDAVFIADSDGRILAQEPQDVPLAAINAEAPASGHAFATIEECDQARCRLYAVLNPTLAPGLPGGRVGGVLDPSSHRLAPLIASVQRALGEAIVLSTPSGRRLPIAEGARDRTPTPAVLPWRARVVTPRPLFPDVFETTSARLALPVLALMAAMLLAFAWGGARSVAGPLETLTRASERMAAGDMQVALPQPGSDEVGRLGAAFQHMRQSLAAARSELEEVNRQLEQRVDERTAELRRLYVELQERDRIRARLLRQVISAQEEERKRVARELHDDTCQMLGAIALRLASPGGADLVTTRQLVIRTIEGVRRQIHDLRPPALDDLGLVGAIRAHADRHLRASGIGVRFEAEVARAELPRDSEIAVFRAVQELITNVERHARASQVVIQVARVDGHLMVDVEDDGRGFEIETAHASNLAGVGLIGVRERVELVGGTFVIDSAPGQGTHARIEVPLTEHEHVANPSRHRG